MTNDALIWVIIVGLTSVGSNIAIMIGVIRRHPPLEVEFVRKPDYEAAMTKNTERHGELFNKIEGVNAGINHQYAELNSKVERLDERTKQTNATVTAISAELTEVGKEVTSALAEIRSRA